MIVERISGTMNQLMPLRRLSLAVLSVWAVLAVFTCSQSRAQALNAGSTAVQLPSNGAAAAIHAVETSEPEGIAEIRPEPGDVVIEGRKVLSVYQPIGNFTAKDRAEKISERLLAFAKEGVRPESVVMKPLPMWTEISAGGNLLLAVSDEDARGAGKSRAQLASDDVESIRQTLMAYRRDHSVRAIMLGIVYSLLATIAFVPFALGLRLLRFSVRDRWAKWVDAKPGEKKSALRVTAACLISALGAIGSLLRWLLLIAMLEIYITVLLSFFPQTRPVSHAVTDWIVDALQSMGTSALAYLPNLFVIAVVVIIASQVSRLLNMLFEEIRTGNLSISGFYPEWAEPSSKLIKALVFALVIIVIFPYLPGSKSPAFQGISIFVGVLLSLGSSSAVASAIAGVILTYMRSFSVGDWVKIGDTVGEVQERSILVTRILTPKQEIITIPNSTVMSGSVVNFTREAKNSGVIFHTTVTIGYDAPWKIVHQLLIDAAAATDGILRNPAPFVLQTQLNDFYVSYEINAYTDVPTRMQFIYSDLHQNIQDRFNEAGVEICSPHFASLRDGNTIAIPERYIAPDYTAPGFRVDEARTGVEHTTSGGR